MKRQVQKKNSKGSERKRFIVSGQRSITLLFLLFTGFIYNLNSQTVVNPEWVRNYSERDSITNIPAAIDANGNIYVTGSTYVIGQNYNVTTIKYNQNGDTVWVRHYNGSANGYDGATALGLDGSGNIFITGRSQGSGTGYDILTLKYNASGTLLWEKRYDGPIHGNDMPTGLALDNSGNVYITGYSVQAGTTTDFITIKYSSAGIQNWVKTYNGPGNGNDRSIAIYLKNNRVFITGFGYEAGGTYAATTISYLGSNGNQGWIKKYGSSASIPDAGGCAIAQYGANIFVSTTTGTSGNYDYTTIAYNNANGNQQWLTSYNAYSLNDIVSSATTDNNGNIFVTGRNLNSNGKYEYHTVKYSQSGVQQWVNKQEVNLTNARTVNKITVDTYNMIYVCGEKRPGYNSDMFLCQITQGGNTQWTETYNGLANGGDAATDMVIDNLGRIFLTGQTYNGNAKFDYTTIKYSQSFIYYPPDFNNEPASSSLSFYENRGQIVNTNNNLVPDVRYYSQGSNPSLYFTNTILSYVFSRVDTNSSTVDTLHRIDQILLNSNPLARVFQQDTAPDYLNYFLAHCPQGITGVKGYKRLFIPNIYPNIDLHYFSNSSGIKYYFVVRPGGNPKDIALQYAGAVNAHIEPNGHLTVNSSIGNIEYDVPTAYQVTPSQNIIPLNWTADWQYFNSPNAVFFKTGNYNTSLPLIIQVDIRHSLLQPLSTNIIWSTYCGSINRDLIYGSVIDNNGKYIITGYSWSSSFPVLNGPYQFLSGDCDIIISAFKDNYNLVYSTYYGGSGIEYGADVDFDNNYVYLISTSASDDIPLFQFNNFYFNGSFTGGPEAIISMISKTTGGIVYSTNFGGSDVDYGSSIKVIGNDIYIIGYTNSDDFPTEYFQGAYNDDIHNGSMDIFISRFNYGTLVWSTYYGGTDDDVASDLCFNLGKLYLYGYTLSSDFPLWMPPNSYQQSYGGNGDACIIKFTFWGEREYAMYIGGSEMESNMFHGLSLSENGNILIVGDTQSDDFPTLDFGGTSFFQGTLDGVGDGFLFELDNQLQQIWGTYYGGSSDFDHFHSCLYRNGVIFATGTTQSDDFPTNEFPNFYYRNTLGYGPGLSDDFIVGFNSDKENAWSTYFGGGGVEDGIELELNDVYLYLGGVSTSINTK